MQWRDIKEEETVEENRVEVWIPTLVYFLLFALTLGPSGELHCTEAEGEGGWQTEAASAPAG